MKRSAGTRGMLIGGPRRAGGRRLTGGLAASRPKRLDSTRLRVLLRPPRKEDAPELVRLVRASRNLHRPWVRPPRDAAEFSTFIRRSREPTVRTLLAVRTEDHAIVGVFTLSQIFLGNFRSAYLGYWVGARFSGQGYMSEGLELLLRHAFGRLRLHRVEANVQPGNLASRALVRRAGFRLEGLSPRYLKIRGRWRDHERWAITVEDLRSAARVRRRPR